MLTIVALGFAVIGALLFVSGMTRVILCFVALIGGGLGAIAATNQNIGVDDLEYEDGVSLRQDSTRSNGGFFVYYASRSHMGGGLSGGK